MEQRVLVSQFGVMIDVVRYTDFYEENWNRFVLENGSDSILHFRSFMDYHKDRFVDFSLILFVDKKIVALLPANLTSDNNMISHAGLTFGGLITNMYDKPINKLVYMKEILRYLDNLGIKKLIYKQPPVFYNYCSQDEIEYAIFLAKGVLSRVDTAFAIDNNTDERTQYQERRKRSIKKAEKLGVQIIEALDFFEFWNVILIPNLQERFGVKPVHSLEEITDLSRKNPNKVRQFNAYFNGEIYAGTTIFETPNVAHSQYISAKNEGRKNGSLDLLFDRLITDVYKDKLHFDFGIVNENGGHNINRGLWDWKEGFGAKAYNHKFFEIKTENYINIVLE